MIHDYLVIAAYFVLVVGIGFAFKRMARNSTSDYFRGGGRMLWWMVGSTAFMAQFSAWTFTGAAGKAFTDGFSVSLVFFANTFAYFCGWAYFAHRFRQMRVDTPTEAIRRRFGAENELFFSWALAAQARRHNKDAIKKGDLIPGSLKKIRRWAWLAHRL